MNKKLFIFLIVFFGVGTNLFCMKEKGVDAANIVDAADKDSGKEEPVSEEKDGAVSEPTADIYYSVHIASFRDINNAAVEAEYFEKKGYDVFVTEVEVKRVKWFRVLIGRFSTKDEAGKTKIELLSFRRIGDARVIKVNK